MKNNYTDQQFKIEEILAISARNLELDDTRQNQMITAYKAINKIFDNDQEFFKDMTVNVYAQGSLIIGTTIKPLPGKEFDLDIVLRLDDSYLNHTPEEIYNEVYRVLSEHGTYKDLLQKKNRCIRINYNSDFHMDILPGCKITSENTRIMIPNDSSLKEWSRTDPKSYAKWFKEISERNKSKFMLTERFMMLTEAKVETEDLPLKVFDKTPLQATVQIIKRFRDLFYENLDKSKHPAISSIVLTTMLAQSYSEELSIQAALVNAVTTMKKKANNYKVHGLKFSVYNPVDEHPEKEKRENFTDSWTNLHYESFAKFVVALEQKINSLLFGQITESKYNEVFGSGFYKQNIQDWVKIEEKRKNNPRLELLQSGKALTSSTGLINNSSGIQNGSHGFYAK